MDNGEPRCIAFGGLRVDDAIGDALLAVVGPGAIAAAVAAETEAGQRRDQVRDALKRDLKRRALSSVGPSVNTMPPIRPTGLWFSADLCTLPSRKRSSQRTQRWRKRDSNPRSLSEGKCWKGRTSRRGGSFFKGGLRVRTRLPPPASQERTGARADAEHAPRLCIGARRASMQTVSRLAAVKPRTSEAHDQMPERHGWTGRSRSGVQMIVRAVKRD
jgi:hypothetical protein